MWRDLIVSRADSDKFKRYFETCRNGILEFIRSRHLFLPKCSQELIKAIHKYCRFLCNSYCTVTDLNSFDDGGNMYEEDIKLAKLVAEASQKMERWTYLEIWYHAPFAGFKDIWVLWLKMYPTNAKAWTTELKAH